MSKPLPVIVGVAQFNARAAGMAESPEPLEMMMRVARGAAEDCDQPDILKSIDAIAVVNIISWGYQNAPAALAEMANHRRRDPSIRSPRHHADAYPLEVPASDLTLAFR